MAAQEGSPEGGGRARGAERAAGSGNGARRPPSVAIVGAGFAGVGLGMRLKRAGIEFTILEKADRVGGVWRDNTYPGLSCDVPSHLYSFSFEPNHEWTRRFPPQAEILAYLERCATKYGLRGHIRFGTEVESAAFDSERGRWRLELAGGGSFEADVLVAATGQLSRPAYPRIPGIDEYEGKLFHSARWDHDCALEGKRVAVIGTGASAIQFVPEIAPRVKLLHVFQRSAPWVVRKPDRPYRRGERALYRLVPRLQSLSRAWDYLSYEVRVLAITRMQWILKPAERAYMRRLRRGVHDRALRAGLVPDYPMGCKRILLSSDYLETMVRPNVELVTAEVAEIAPDGVVTADGRKRAVDAIVLGTGFEANDFLAPMRITGLGARELNEAWRGGAEAYLGITVAGFPNLYILYGPNTNLGANSIVYMLESQIAYVFDGLLALTRTGARYLDVRDEVQRAFSAELQERLEGSVWQAGCHSWYLNEEGRNTNNWPGMTFEYRRRTRRFELADYVAASG